MRRGAEIRREMQNENENENEEGNTQNVFVHSKYSHTSTVCVTLPPCVLCVESQLAAPIKIHLHHAVESFNIQSGNSLCVLWVE